MERTYSEGIKLLGLKIEERTEPWDGACGVFHPVLSEVVKFQAETILSTFPASGPVKTQIIGPVDKKTQDAANRVRENMNYELTENAGVQNRTREITLVFADCGVSF